MKFLEQAGNYSRVPKPALMLQILKSMLQLGKGEITEKEARFKQELVLESARKRIAACIARYWPIIR